MFQPHYPNHQVIAFHAWNNRYVERLMLVLRISVHTTTFSRRTGRVFPAPPHITASYMHGPSATEYVGHINVNHYTRPDSTNWTMLSREGLTWGAPGSERLYCFSSFGRRIKNEFHSRGSEKNADNIKEAVVNSSIVPVIDDETRLTKKI